MNFRALLKRIAESEAFFYIESHWWNGPDAANELVRLVRRVDGSVTQSADSVLLLLRDAYPLACHAWLIFHSGQAQGEPLLHWFLTEARPLPKHRLKIRRRRSSRARQTQATEVFPVENERKEDGILVSAVENKPIAANEPQKKKKMKLPNVPVRKVSSQVVAEVETPDAAAVFEQPPRQDTVPAEAPGDYPMRKEKMVSKSEPEPTVATSTASDNGANLPITGQWVLDTLERADDYQFILPNRRDDDVLDGYTFSLHLQDKAMQLGIPMSLSVRDFIERAASGSKRFKRPYYVIRPDGQKVLLRQWLLGRLAQGGKERRADD